MSRARGLSPIDLVRDSRSNLRARLGRTAMLVVAVALSCGALVASLSLSAAGTAQVREDVARAAMRHIVAKTSTTGTDLDERGPERVEHLALVRAAGVRTDLETQAAAPRSVLGRQVSNVSVFGASSGYLRAAGYSPAESHPFLDDLVPRRIALVGADVAEEVGVPPSGGDGYAIELYGERYTVAGVLGSGTVPGMDFSRSIIVAGRDARDRTGSAERTTTVLVEVEAGAFGPVSSVLPDLLAPGRPQQIQVSAGVDYAEVGARVDSTVARWALIAGVVLVLVTGVLLGNALGYSVMTRTDEIGLRRALGASRLEVAVVFVAEAQLIGVMGSIAGTGLAISAIGAARVSLGWDFPFDLGMWLLGPVVGVAVGFLGGLVPAWFASRIQPATAMRFD